MNSVERLCATLICGGVLSGQAIAAEMLPIYQPKVKHAAIYFYHPAAKPALRYNHDVDIVKFKGRFFAAWNANTSPGEGKPGQFNYLSHSDDFENWTAPVRMFFKEAGCENPIETDNQWQPIFINYRDQTLFCAWCDCVARKTYVSTSTDGLRWRNREVSNAPPSLAGKVVGFPTNHGLLTSKGVMMFPCSLPSVEGRAINVGKTIYAGVLYSVDAGKTWQWSEPIEAMKWSEIGEKPAEFGGETVCIWEPMLFEQADGRIGLLIRNSTAQQFQERMEKPHRMLLYATSSDHGRTWTKARTVEVDTICSRNFAVASVGTRDSLLMVMNDNHVRVPDRIPHDRYFLALFCAPVCDPDLLLPGPVIQPAGGTAFYPNGFVADGKLYVAYSHNGIHSSVIEPLPDFTKPFLLPRGGRPGLSIENGIAYFGQKQTSLGLVLTEKLTRQPKLRLAFDVNVHRYNGSDWPILTLGGKTCQRTALRAIYSEEKKSDLFQVRLHGNNWADIAPFKMKTWNHIEVGMTETGFSVSVNQSPAQSFPLPLLRKICFGGLYATPEWPIGRSASSDIRLKLNSILVK